MTRYREPSVEYWQVRTSGEIMECPGAEERSPEWHKAYRQVRLFIHHESGHVFVEDYHAPAHVLQNHHEAQADEVPLHVYKYWKLIYDNPDL